jgi:hypothetical protein
MSELLNEYTPDRIMAVIQQITKEYKDKMVAVMDLQARITKTTNPDEILARISNYDLELVPPLIQLIRNPDDKYWYTNILTSVASELFRVGNMWEWLDGEFTGLNTNNPNFVIDILLGIYNSELLFTIRETLKQTH